MPLHWLLQRALSGGQEFARKSLSGLYGPMSPLAKFLLFAKAGAQFLVAMLLALVSLPLGRHRSAAWLVKAATNAGKLSVASGWRYHEYAKTMP